MFNFRSSDESLSVGTISSQAYMKDKSRSLVSLKVCFLAWAWELLGTITYLIIPVIGPFGLSYLHCFDALLTFILLPIVYLANDEDTKTVIAEHGWYIGLRDMFSI